MSTKINQVEELIQELRKRNNLSVSELSEKMYVSRQAVHYWEKGRSKVSVETLELLLNVLDEAVLIGSDGYKIMEEKNMYRNKNIKEQFKLDYDKFEEFNADEFIRGYQMEWNDFKELKIAQFNTLVEGLKERGYTVNIGKSYNPEYYLTEFCKEGNVLEISKNSRSVSINIEKNSLVLSFDWDAFINDIDDRYGKDTASYIKKAMCFTGCNYRVSEDIFKHLRYNSEKSKENTLIDIVPALKGYEDIIYMQILENRDKYFSELEGVTYEKEFPTGHTLGFYQAFMGDTLCVTLENEKGEKKSAESRLLRQVVVDVLKYIDKNVDTFDEWFQESINELSWLIS